MSDVRELGLCAAINEAYVEEMSRDDSVFVLGCSIQAGTFPTTAGLAERFGKNRVIDTPLAEPNMAGLAFGAAVLAGRRRGKSRNSRRWN